MTQFQGYARASSVSENTIKVHDPSEKILAESQKTLSRWRARSQAEQGARNQYLQGLKQKFNSEQAQRNSNRALEKEFAEGWKKAVQQNWEIRVKDAENKAKNSQPGLLAELAEFAPSIVGNLQKIDEQRRADGTALGQALAFEFGISIQDLDALKNVKGNLRDYEGKNVSIINTLQDKGVSFDQMQQFRRLSGYRRLGVAEADLIRAAENHQSWQVNQLNREIELPGGLGTHSLASAQKSGNYQKLVPAVNLALRTEYLSKYSSYDKDLVSKHLRDTIIRNEGRMISFAAQEDLKKQREDFVTQEKSLLATEIKTGGVDGNRAKAYLDWIRLQAGENGEKFSQANATQHGYLASLIEEGVLGADFILELQEHEVTPNGEKKTVKYGDRWGKKIDELWEAEEKYQKKIADKFEAERQMEEVYHKNIADDAEDYIIANREKLNPEDYSRMYQAAIRSGNTPLQQKINAYWGLRPNAVNDKFNIPMLQSLENSNMLTRSAVIKAGLSAAKESEWLKKATDNDPFTPTDAIDKSFETEAKRAVENILTRYGTESKKVQSSALATTNGINMMRRYYKKAMIATNGDTEASKIQAIAEFNQLLTTDAYKISERRSVNGVIIQEPHFAHFQVSPAKFAYPLSQFTTEKIRKNPDIFREEIMIPPSEIVEWGNNVKAGINKGFPISVYHLTNKVIGLNPDGTPKVTEAEVAKNQLILVVGQEKADQLVPDELIGISRQAQDMIDPEFQKLLCYGPDAINCALHYSKQTQSKDYKPKEVTGTHSSWQSGSIYRLPENLNEETRRLTMKQAFGVK